MQLQAAETFLKEVCGLSHAQAAAVLDSAMAWRYKHGGPTPGEMKLHQACHRNLVRVAEALQQDCGVPPGLLCRRTVNLHAQLMVVWVRAGTGSVVERHLSDQHDNRALKVRSVKDLTCL